MKQMSADKEEIMQRAKDMEASMAIEGIYLHPEDRAITDEILMSDMSEDEAFERIKQHLIERGLDIKTDRDELSDVAE